MFHTFFPRPRLFFASAVIWTIVCVAVWYGGARDFGAALGIGHLMGLNDPARAAHLSVRGNVTLSAFHGWPGTIWFYQYMVVSFLVFVGIWMWFAPHRWSYWSVLGSAVITFAAWCQVELDVMINRWFGGFYDAVQKALSAPGKVTLQSFDGLMLTFMIIALVYVTISVVSSFLVSHYVFRWRTAMNEFYMSNWQRLRQVEGASQRVQEDTMRFSSIAEGLGMRFIDSVMTLAAFLPILWGLSAHITSLPIVGEVSQGLVFVALLWSIGGTGLLALAGVKLPGLEFRNQRVEAAYRKELVLGEDHPERAAPPTVRELFADVRRSYFRLYVNFLYFNIVRYAYLQAGVLVPYIALGPTIVSGTITLGLMQQIIRAFNRVETSFQFLVNSWTTIVEMLSIYKRLAAFSATLDGEPLAPIEEQNSDAALLAK
jgi:peptide/bleomycin uptake transporter